MTQEVAEAWAKLGVDVTQLKVATREVDNFSQAGTKSFFKVGSEAKSFKKIIDQISQQSPIMGLALRAAFNPVVATLSLATAAAAGFNKILEEVNTSLDRIAERNAKPITDSGRMAQAVAEQVAAVRKGHKDFVAGIQGKAPKASDAIEEGQQLVKDIFEPPAAMNPKLAAAQRALLTASRDELQKQAMQAESQMLAAKEGAENPHVVRSMERAKQTIEDLKSRIAEIKSQEVKLREAEVEDEQYAEKSGWLGGLPTSWRSLKGEARGLLGLPADDPGGQLNQMRKYQEELKRLEASLAKLTKINQTDNATYKEKSTQLAALIEQIRKLDKELYKLPPAVSPSPVQPQSPQIDPRTGGIPYKPLQYRPLTYKPIPGAPGYMPPVPEIPKSQQETQAAIVARIVVNILQELSKPVPVALTDVTMEDK